jgi:hypothetical protein
VKQRKSKRHAQDLRVWEKNGKDMVRVSARKFLYGEDRWSETKSFLSKKEDSSLCSE